MAQNKLLKLIGSAGKSLAFGDYIDVVSPSVYRGGFFNGQFFFGGNGIDYRFQYNNHRSAAVAYESCPPLAAVINRKAQCYINGVTKVVNTQNKEANSLQAQKLRKLLKKPNPMQTWAQFEAQQYIYIQLFGFCVTVPIIPAGYTDPIDATSMWNLPPYLLAIQEKTNVNPLFATSFKDLIDYIKITFGRETYTLPLDSLYIFTDFVPSMLTFVFPESRVKACAMPVNNIIGAYMSRNELINYAGAQGIFSPETNDVAGSIPLKEDEKSQLQDDFKRMYGIQRGQYRYIISPAAIKWSTIGKPTKDLMLFEEIIDDIMRICDAFGYPSPLLNSEKGPSVSNTSAYQAQVYSGAIIPESLDYYEQWNIFLGIDKYNLKLTKDFSDIPELQDNREASGRALYYLNQSNEILWNMNLITANEIREANELEPIPGADGKYLTDWIADGKVPGPSPQKGALPNSNTTQNENTDTGQTGKP